MKNPGRLIGVGTGPGDPELLTVKAVKAIEAAHVIAYFAKQGRGGNGKAIVEHLLSAEKTLLPLYYPVTTEIEKGRRLIANRLPPSTINRQTRSLAIWRRAASLPC